MPFSSWLPKRKRPDTAARRRTPPAARERISLRPLLETLEDRCVPSAGALDPTFGNGGKLTTDFPGPTNDIGLAASVIQADGKIVVAGDAFSVGGGGGPALVRYNSDGSLDTTFGSGGKVVPDFKAFGGGISALAIQGDGKILAAGAAPGATAGEDFAVVRYNANGSLDTAFGSGGEVLTDFGGFDSARGVVIQADGKIAVAGTSFQSGPAADFALARYNANGSLDTTFGTGGKVLTAFAGALAQATSLAIQADGKLVAAGSTLVQSTNVSQFALARYNRDGSLDTAFGTGGEVTTVLSLADFAESVAVQADGKIVAAGFSQQSASAEDFALARYNPDGSLDTSFGTGGTVLTDFGGSNDGALGVAIQADGKIVAAGFSFQFATSEDFALARYNSGGGLDSTFGAGGKVTIDFGNTFDSGQALALQSDGRIVVAGFSQQPATGADFALARCNSNGTLDTTLGTGGTVTTNIGMGPDDDFGHGGIALQADGKIVQAGSTNGFNSQDFALTRYNSDGSRDTSFGTGGEVVTDLGGFALASAVTIQADGKILVVGEIEENATFDLNIAMARYNPDGSLDASFGTGGIVTTDLGGFEIGNAVALQADGKIVVAGAAGGSGFALVRYNSDGSPDSTFGSGGVAAINFAGLGDEAESVAIQADGKIVAAGLSNQASTGSDFALARFNANGTLDTSFGSGGKVTTDFAGQFDVASQVAIQADGKIVAGGNSYQGKKTGDDFAVVRYNSNGSLDSSFNKAGKATADFGSFDDEAFGMALQGDGKVIIAGESAQSTGFDFALARFNGDGTPDKGFGTGGEVITVFAGESQIIGVAIQADGNIVAGGTAVQPGTGFDFAGARYIGASASQPINTIIASVQSLVRGGVLNNGQGNALLVKLQHAVEHADDGQITTAVNDLQAFVNEVNDFVTESILTSAQGQLLISEAEAAMALLQQKK